VPSNSDFTATALWAMEEALRAPSVGLVCAEIEEMDLTTSRRLQLAAETSGGLGLLLRRAPATGRENAPPPTASVSRWRITSRPGSPAEAAWLPARLPGQPRWQVELLRARGGQPRSWQLEWRDDRHNNSRDATGGFALVPPLRDRPLPQKAPLPSVPHGKRQARTG
jgi:protein ImuA